VRKEYGLGARAIEQRGEGCWVGRMVMERDIMLWPRVLVDQGNGLHTQERDAAPLGEAQ
jgi:hypothetical protein